MEEPAFTHKEVRELVSRWCDRPETVNLHQEILIAKSRSNATANACAVDLVHSSLTRLRVTNDRLVRTLTKHSAAAAVAALDEIVGWIEFVWMGVDAEIVQARRTLLASSALLDATNAFAAHASSAVALELLKRERDVALASARECEQPWEMYFKATPQMGQPSSALAREILNSASASLAPVIAEELLSMFEKQDGLELGLRRDAQRERGDLLWALEVIESPLYSAGHRERLIELFEFARTAVDERATNIVQNAKRYLATVAMMSVDNSWITDYPAFAAAHGQVLTAAWQAATSESEEFRSAQFLSGLLSHLLARGIPEELFPTPQWLADELEQSAGSSASTRTPPVTLASGAIRGIA